MPLLSSICVIYETLFRVLSICQCVSPLEGHSNQGVCTRKIAGKIGELTENNWWRCMHNRTNYTKTTFPEASDGCAVYRNIVALTTIVNICIHTSIIFLHVEIYTCCCISLLSSLCREHNVQRRHHWLLDEVAQFWHSCVHSFSFSR